MPGVQGRGLQALLGHKDPRMTMRYSHLSDTTSAKQWIGSTSVRKFREMAPIWHRTLPTKKCRLTSS